MPLSYDNNELYHFGVKGMRWGVRKSRRSDGAPSKRQSRKAIKKQLNTLDEVRRKRYAETDISKMSTQELRELNNRIREENAYIKEMTPEASSFSKAVKVTEDILGGPIGKAAGAAVSTYLTIKGAEYVSKWYKTSEKAEEAKNLFKAFMKPKR